MIKYKNLSLCILVNLSIKDIVYLVNLSIKDIVYLVNLSIKDVVYLVNLSIKDIVYLVNLSIKGRLYYVTWSAKTQHNSGFHKILFYCNIIYCYLGSLKSVYSQNLIPLGPIAVRHKAEC